MTAALKPENADQVLEAVAWAAGEGTPLEVVGGGSKRCLGRPVQTAHTLDLSALRGITLYEPEELVLTAGPGTPMAEIQGVLDEKRQQLAFEPPDLGALLGGEAGVGTLGAVLACNLSGPRRIKAGAARDHFLGFQAVSGRGEVFKSGGRVVKNVTGYDLMKLMAGAYGTLAAMTEVTVKVLPRPEKTYTALLLGLEDGAAIEAMTLALNSAHEVTAAAHLPVAAAMASKVGYVAGTGGAVTALRVEGPGPSVIYRCAELRKLLEKFGDTEELHSQNSVTFWQEIRDVHPFSIQDDGAVWKISVPPSQGAVVTAAVPGASAFYDWGGGLVWLAVDGSAEVEDVRTAVAVAGGHATLIRAAEEIRAVVPVFQPQPLALAALTRRVKEAFDPQRVLNPSRMYAGI